MTKDGIRTLSILTVVGPFCLLLAVSFGRLWYTVAVEQEKEGSWMDMFEICMLVRLVLNRLTASVILHCFGDLRALGAIEEDGNRFTDITSHVQVGQIGRVKSLSESIIGQIITPR